ncbi:MAG TPA: arginine--tRNA ligase [Anaerolineales bacterium]|nr:arginine--tRNA ligase [Anaerolineales bacterium]
MQSIIPTLTELVENALQACAQKHAWQLEQPINIAISPAKNPQWGEFSSAIALQLAKLTAKKPIDIANELMAHLPASEMVQTVNVSVPGFLNFSISQNWLSAQIPQILSTGASYWNSNDGQGKKAMVEFVSANPTGPLSVGRGRGGVVGDTFANILQAVGYDVTREYYFNNAGNQMRLLGESLQIRYLQVLGEAVELGENHYQGEYLFELGKRLVAEKGESLRTAEVETFSKYAELAMFDSIKATLERMNIYMDVYFNENSLFEDGSVWDVVNRLTAGGFTYEKDGAIWFVTTRFGVEKDRVLVRSQGVPTYRLPDIAYHENKLRRGFELIVDVLGADHKDEFPDVKMGVEALGYNADGIHLLMNQFVSVKGQRMSTRAGRFTTLDELMDEVGADVVRFFMLQRDSSSHLEFDLDLALEQSEKNPVFYVQYAHARISSILRKAQEEGYSFENADLALLAEPAEKALLLKLLELSEVVRMCAKEFAPHHLTYYARDLASAFHAFYRDCRVLDSQNLPLSTARLQLTAVAQIGLARALHLCGVSAPETM